MSCQISSSALIISTVIKIGENRTDFDALGVQILPLALHLVT